VVYVTSVFPQDLHWDNVLVIGLAALLITGARDRASARRAARIAPAEALRYRSDARDDALGIVGRRGGN
jgi:ABC-type lipoprotein release transport system permease subunit